MMRRLDWKRLGWKNRRALLAVGLVMLLLLAGCQGSRRRNFSEEGVVRAIAVVNNEKIPFEAFQNDYQLFLTRWDNLIKKDPERKQAIKELLLERKINEILLDQEARRKGIDVDDEEITREMIALFSSIEDTGGDREEIRPQGEMAAWRHRYKRRLIHDRLIRQEVTEKIRPTNAELRAFYRRFRDSFRREEMVSVSHIAVGSRSLFNRVMNLLERRRKFVDLVRKYSITPDRFADGKLGYVKRGVLPSEFDEAIFNMKTVGSVTPRRNPVQTQMGFHIFRLDGRRSAGLMTFRQALPEIRRRLVQEKQAEAYRKWIDSLRERATILVDTDLLNVE